MAEPAIIFLALFVVLVCAAIFHDAVWGVCLYLGMYFISPWSRWWGYSIPELRWMQIVSLVVLVALVLRWRKYQNRRIFDERSMKVLFAFSLLLIAVTPLAIWPDRHALVVGRHFKVLLIVYAMYKVIDKRWKLEAVIWSYLLGMFYVASVAKDMGRTGGGRLDGIGTIDSTDVNDLASVFIIGMACIVFYAMEGRRWWIKLVALMAMAYCFNALILMNSRGAFLGFLVCMGLYLLATVFIVKRTFGFKMKVLAAMLAAASLFIYLADDSFWERQRTLTTQESEEGGGDQGRITIWKHAVELAGEHPFGLGAHGFTAMSAAILPVELLDGMTMRAVHSTYLEILTAYGFAGLALFLWYLGSSYSSMMKSQRTLQVQGDSYGYLLGYALMAGYAGFLVSAIFITRVYAEAAFYGPTIMAAFSSIVRSETAGNASTGPSATTPSTRARGIRAPD